MLTLLAVSKIIHVPRLLETVLLTYMYSTTYSGYQRQYSLKSKYSYQNKLQQQQYFIYTRFAIKMRRIVQIPKAMLTVGLLLILGMHVVLLILLLILLHHHP